MTTDHERMVNAAVWLAEQDFADIGWAPRKDGKAPIRRWKADATDEPSMVPNLLAGARNSLVIPKGRGLVIDSDDGRAWDELIHAGLPDTFAVDTPTPGHFHVFGWAPDGIEMQDIPGSFEWGEIRRSVIDQRTSSMVLGPWSKRDGGVYRPRTDTREIATLPASIIAYLQESSLRKRSRESAASGPQDEGWVIQRGKHDFLMSRARHLRGVGLTGERLVEELLRLDAERCDPSIATIPGRGRKEIEDIVTWVMREIGDDPPGVTLVTNGKDKQARPSTRRHLRLTSAKDIPVKPVKWVWDGRLPLGEIALLGGREGIGKSLIADGWLAAQVTRGTLPGVFYGTPRDVIIVATEDSWEHTIVPRLMAAEADLARVHRVEAVTSDGLGVELSLPDDHDHLTRVIGEVNAGLVIFDPLVSRLDASLDTHKDAEVRRALEPLRRIAETTATLFLGLIHVNKSKHADPLTMLMASRAFTAVPRAVLFLVIDPEDRTRRLLGQPKNNLGRSDLPTLALHIEGAKVADTDEGPVWTGRAIWDGESDMDIADAVGADGEGMETRTTTAECVEWLQDFLTGAEKPRSKVSSEAKRAGFSESTLKRAAKKLSVVSDSSGFPRTAHWSLPVHQSDQDSSVSRSSAGESYLTELTGLTGEEGSSRSSRSSRISLQNGGPTATVDLDLAELATDDDVVPICGCGKPKVEADPDCWVSTDPEHRYEPQVGAHR